MRFRSFAVAGLALSAMVATAQDRDTTVYEPGNGVSPPMVTKMVQAIYTPEARTAGIEGTVWVGMVVLPDGTPGDVYVIKSLDTKFGLDEQAVKASKQFRFKPGMKDGKAVATRVSVEQSFSLNSK